MAGAAVRLESVSTTARILPEAATIPATDGVALQSYVYVPRAEARCSALVLPGIGVPQRAFRHFASWLALHGIRTVTVDYRGMGESRGAAATGASLSIWAGRDAVGALRFTESFAAPVVLVGHSFGGQMLGFSNEFRRLQAAVLVCSSFGQARHWNRLSRLKIAAYWRAILPLAAALFEAVPGWTGLGEALPHGVAREWARWGRTEDWLLSHVDGARARYRAFDRPLRAYAIEDDPIAPPRAVSDLLQQFDAARVDRVDLAPADLGLTKLGHFGLFRPGPAERIWRDIAAFAFEHSAAPRPDACALSRGAFPSVTARALALQ
jgi:predicted alpha/beta hydrolase